MTETQELSNDGVGAHGRPWGAIWCILTSHSPVEHTAYKLKNDLGRAVYGDFCEDCGAFLPREGAEEDFEEPGPTSFEEAIRDRTG